MNNDFVIIDLKTYNNTKPIILPDEHKRRKKKWSYSLVIVIIDRSSLHCTSRATRNMIMILIVESF